VADALQVKRPHKEASLFMVEIAWRIDAIAAWLLNRKRKLHRPQQLLLTRQIGIRMTKKKGP
jgi:hypothetical protein